jgi:serine/threonine-protein kinase
MEITNYKVTKELGRGGMAIVYLAHDNKFDTNVAVKVLNKELVNNENIRKRFIAEARKMFKMSHPNIIKVTDLIEEGDTVAFVMEYVEGETLKDYIDRKGKLSNEEIKNLFTQMLDAVGYVHEQNLVHRDIKPSNFMLDKKGRIKLMDFGIAKITDTFSAEYTQTGTGVLMGTPMYMSPEQITETKSVTDQSDIYSLGVVLWQMVTGQKPYNTNTLSSFQLQTKIVNEPLDNTNSHWDELIQKANHEPKSKG